MTSITLLSCMAHLSREESGPRPDITEQQQDRHNLVHVYLVVCNELPSVVCHGRRLHCIHLAGAGLKTKPGWLSGGMQPPEVYHPRQWSTPHPVPLLQRWPRSQSQCPRPGPPEHHNNSHIMGFVYVQTEPCRQMTAELRQIRTCLVVELPPVAHHCLEVRPCALVVLQHLLLQHPCLPYTALHSIQQLSTPGAQQDRLVWLARWDTPFLAAQPCNSH
jgi:hypothetical protein